MCVMRWGLRICANYEDVLLPMVHQNWPALVARARNPLFGANAIDVSVHGCCAHVRLMYSVL